MADNIYGSTWTTAANTQVGSYPYINLSQTEAGHMDMKDDTPGNESMRLRTLRSPSRKETCHHN